MPMSVIIARECHPVLGLSARYSIDSHEGLGQPG